jgi:predicted transcriptional regulator
MVERVAEHPDDFFTAIQHTPSAGYHLPFFSSRGGFRILHKGEIAPGIDFQTSHIGPDGKTKYSYIAAWPSQILLSENPKEGEPDYDPNLKEGQYTWATAGDEIEIPEMPDWLEEEVLAACAGKRSKTKSAGAADHSQDERNNKLTSVAGRLRNDGLSAESIKECLKAYNKEWYAGHPSGVLPWKEVSGIANSIGHREVKPPAAEETAKELVIYNAADLVLRDMPPMDWLIENIIPCDGVSVIGDRPKKGKSWLALQAAVAISDGVPFLGRFKTTQSRVLYFALEDGDRRIHSRLQQVPHGDLNNLDFCHEGLRLSVAGAGPMIKKLDEAVADKRPYRMVIVDTFLKAAPQRKGNMDTVRADYDEMSVLRDICLKYHLGILVIHHTRKPARGDDPTSIDSLIGTSGVTASPDALIVLGTNADGDRLMTVSGKDAGLKDTQAMEFDGDATPPWTCLGSAFLLQIGEARENVINYLGENGPATSTTICKALDEKIGTINKLLKHMAKDSLVQRDEKKAWSLTPIVMETWKKKEGCAAEVDLNAITETMASKKVM